MAWLLTRLLLVYRYAISPMFGSCCRFWPSCSAYAIEAIETHGAIVGCGYTLRRLVKCHRWHPGGFDPVPAPSSHCCNALQSFSEKQ